MVRTTIKRALKGFKRAFGGCRDTATNWTARGAFGPLFCVKTTNPKTKCRGLDGQGRTRADIWTDIWADKIVQLGRTKRCLESVKGGGA